MKILTIGDIHGESFWKSLIKQHSEVDKIIFVGDYVDSFTVKNVLMLHNLKNIITLKHNNPDKYVLLLGNHDVQYIDFSNNYGRCSGYRSNMKLEFYKLFIENINLFQIAYKQYDYLWTHAGVHSGWYKFKFLKEIAYKHPDWIGNQIDTQLNKAYNSPLMDSIHDVGYDRGGMKQVGGPLWIDKKNTWNKALRGYHQIVGHTKIDNVVRRDINAFTSITYVDSYPEGEGHYIIDL